VKLGARVIIWDVSVKDLENTAEELGRSVSAARVDVANPDDVAAAAAKAGDVDILINNAGIVNGKALLELAPAQVQRILAINTFSQFLTIRAFLPRMLERNSGQIVAISSQAGLIGYARLADYAASKHALLGLMESLALELREKRSAVVTTTVCPYFVRTGLFDFDKGGVVPSVMPVMTQDFVADEIVEGVVRAEPRVVIPKVLRWLVAMRLLPYHLQLRVLEGTFFTSLIGIIQKAVR
jgi:all-trans-retinol dehydrogenase (NAD+)